MKKLLIIFIGLILITCGEEEVKSRAYPRVRTHAVDNITSSGVALHAEITFSSTEIIDHGFVFSTSPSPTLENAEVISLGPKSGKGTFESNLISYLTKGAKYFVKGFARSKTHIVYGEAVSFISMGSTPPEISNFFPQEGVSSDTVLIKGRYFSSISTNNSVKFGIVPSSVLKSTDSTIQCIVPALKAGQDYPLSVVVAGNTGTASNKFKLLAPEIYGLNKLEGIFGDTIIVDGKNFPKEIVYIKFTLDDIPCNVFNASKNQFSAIVPNNLTKSRNQIAAKISEVNMNAGEFYIKPPEIVNITNTILTAVNNPPLLISGHNFNPVTTSNNVYIGGYSCTVLSASLTQLSVQPPNQFIQDIELSVRDTFDVEIMVLDQSDILEKKIIVSYLSRWTRMKDFPGSPRIFGATFEINGQGYIGLGSGEAFDYWYKDFWKYDPTNDNWTQLPDFPGQARSKFVTLIINSKAYIIGGIVDHYNTGLSEELNEVWEFDPSTNLWTRKNDFPGGKRQVAFGFVINNTGYFGGGKNSTTGEKNDFWKYNSNTDNWTQLNNAPYYLRGEGVLALTNGTDGYVLTENCDLGCSNRFLWKYDRLNDVWLDMPDTPYRYREVTGFSLNDKFYVATGIDSNWPGSRAFFEYNINSASWKAGYEFKGQGRRTASSFAIGNYGYILLGQSDCHCANLNDVWRFDPSKP